MKYLNLSLFFLFCLCFGKVEAQNKSRKEVPKSPLEIKNIRTKNISGLPSKKIMPNMETRQASLAAQLLSSDEEKKVWRLEQLFIQKKARGKAESEYVPFLEKQKEIFQLGSKLYILEESKNIIWLDPQQQSFIGKQEKQNEEIKLKFQANTLCKFCEYVLKYKESLEPKLDIYIEDLGLKLSFQRSN